MNNELERRVHALELQHENLARDIVKYTEHCIKLMRAVTELGIAMQDAGLNTSAAAYQLRDGKAFN
jgi:hypothetical protein